jgi:hypothetical protein
MHRNPERLAWTVLVISLLICIGLTITVPVAVSRFINDTTETTPITLEAWAGVPLVYPPSQDIPTGVTVRQDNLPARSTIRTDQNTQALLSIRARRNGPTLLTVQIYGSAELVIEKAQSPRYSQSVEPYRVHLSLKRGQVRVTVAGNNDLDRTLDAQLVAPVVTATAALETGAYSFDVSGNEMDLKVWDGRAAVHGEQGPILTLKPSQRTRVSLGESPDVALPPEQNLILNGDFRQPLTNVWEVTSKVDQLHPNDPLGAVAVVSGTNGYAALFQRTGTYHAETDLTQFTHTGVLTGFHSVKLYFDVQVDSQDVPLCGSQGSECPMMVQLDYLDIDGNSHSYFQGFYAVDDPSGINPTSCILCETHNEHIKVPGGVPWPFETGNLLPLLSLKQITAIRFYASGHSYQSSISNVELIAEK